MKEKMKNYLNESVSKPVLNHSNEYTFTSKARKTLGSEEDANEKIKWNTSTHNLAHLCSPPKVRIAYKDIDGLVEENRRLKEEIRTMKELLMDSSILKTY